MRPHLVDEESEAPTALILEDPGCKYEYRFTGVDEEVLIRAAESVTFLPPGVGRLVGGEVLPTGSVLLGFSHPLGPAASARWGSEFGEYIVSVPFSFFVAFCFHWFSVGRCGRGAGQWARLAYCC